ncbi:hypothetical protein ZHAS_00017289 [Anopheles sinensis]|uniref:Uncharacterized protein n=1 Tax=Anopheles sinensis TaxID=74873 RepID=A0A084WFT7_ANOSI|nr:hypothetical protein ZHAS_00017289 [Anopheles sinensis]
MVGAQSESTLRCVFVCTMKPKRTPGDTFGTNCSSTVTGFRTARNEIDIGFAYSVEPGGTMGPMIARGLQTVV